MPELEDCYSAGAEAYRKYWAPLLLEPGRRLVAGMHIPADGLVLEVAAGVGALLPYIAGSAPRVDVVAVDLSLGMLSRASAHYPRVLADVVRLPFVPEIFDGAVMAFALFHVLSPGRAAAELHRVLKPSGTVGLSTWLEVADECVANKIWSEELQNRGVDPAPWPGSSDQVGRPEKLLQLLKKAGFEDIHVDSVQVIDTMSPSEFVERRTSVGRSMYCFQQLPPDERREFVSNVRNRVEGLSTSDLTSKETALLAWARRPNA